MPTRQKPTKFLSSLGLDLSEAESYFVGVIRVGDLKKFDLSSGRGVGLVEARIADSTKPMMI